MGASLMPGKPGRCGNRVTYHCRSLHDGTGSAYVPAVA